MGGPWQELAKQVAESAGLLLDVGARTSRGGGCINEAWMIPAMVVETGRQVNVFVKGNHPETLPMFEAEQEALELIHSTGAIRVPRPLAIGVVGESMAFLALEGLEIAPVSQGFNQREMGVQLAELHKVTSKSGAYGWSRDNTIGATLQRNAWRSDWVTFFGEQRLGYQLELAARRGRVFRAAEALLDRLPTFFPNEELPPRPSLLHGDLWGGNAGFLPDGRAVFFDPASYYGDRETDLAFTSLFGGFGRAFYEGYESVWPLDAGFSRRQALYNLYHVLNHDHLFGGSYGQQAQDMIDRLLGE